MFPTRVERRPFWMNSSSSIRSQYIRKNSQNHHTMTRATGLYKYRTPAPTTWRCPRSQIRTRTRRPTKVCAACTPGKHAQAASQTLFMHQLGVIRVSLVTLQKSLKLIHKTNRFVFTGVHSFYT